jgi:hypothetical protein
MHIVYFFFAEYFWGQNISDEKTGKASKRGRDSVAYRTSDSYRMA